MDKLIEIMAMSITVSITVLTIGVFLFFLVGITVLPFYFIYSLFQWMAS